MHNQREGAKKNFYRRTAAAEKKHKADSYFTLSQNFIFSQFYAC